MRMFLHLFLNLLLPLSILFVVLSIGYFTFDYNFSKAVKIGILLGVLIGIGVSLITAFALLILRSVQKEKVPVSTNAVEETEQQEERTQSTQAERGIVKEIQCMLLMDKELSFNVILNALSQDMGCTVSESDPEKGTLHIQTEEGSIQTKITSLTQHTSQVIIHAIHNAKEVRQILSHVKEKEHAFLQY